MKDEPKAKKRPKAKRRTKARKHRFLVGYRGGLQCVYGRTYPDAKSNGYADPMTEFQALRFQANALCPDSVVYELVEVTP